jgi:hypothetical protein
MACNIQLPPSMPHILLIGQTSQNSGTWLNGHADQIPCDCFRDVRSTFILPYTLGSGRGVVIDTQGPVVLAVVDLPEFILGVVSSCVHPLQAAKLPELLFDGTVLHDKGLVVGGARTPDTDVEEHLFRLTRFFVLGFTAVWGEGEPVSFPKWAQRKR